jgi:hypothetical protein
MRVYLPATPHGLRALVSVGALAAPLRGHAVTEAVLAELADQGEEEREYAVLMAAAEDAVGLLEAGEPAVRIVVVADVEALPDGSLSGVTVGDDVRLRQVLAVHADGPEARADVEAARDAAGSSDELRERLLERCAGHDLGWYATQEAADLLVALEA